MGKKGKPKQTKNKQKREKEKERGEEESFPQRPNHLKEKKCALLLVNFSLYSLSSSQKKKKKKGGRERRGEREGEREREERWRFLDRDFVLSVLKTCRLLGWEIIWIKTPFIQEKEGKGEEEKEEKGEKEEKEEKEEKDEEEREEDHYLEKEDCNFLLNWRNSPQNCREEKEKEEEEEEKEKEEEKGKCGQNSLLQLLQKLAIETVFVCGGKAENEINEILSLLLSSLSSQIFVIRDCLSSSLSSSQLDQFLVSLKGGQLSFVTSYEMGVWVQPQKMMRTIVNKTRIIYNATSSSNAYFTLLNEVNWGNMYNHGRPVARLVALQGSLANGNEPFYRHPVDIHPLFRPWTPFVGTLREKIEELTNEKFNHVLIQYYRTFSDQIQSHTDKTLDIVEGSSIVNLSFGATREMTLKGKDFGRNGKRPHFYVNLVHDSLFILDSVTNRTYQHAVKSNRTTEAGRRLDQRFEHSGRISLTFRLIHTFVDPHGLVFGGGGKFKTFQEKREALWHIFDYPAVKNSGNKKKRKILNEDLLEIEQQKMLAVFGAENHKSNFDWKENYGTGFDVIDFSEINLELFFVPSEYRPTLYWVNGNISSWRVILCLRYLKIQFESRRLRRTTKPKQTKSREFLELNPKGKAPLFVDVDGTFVSEPFEICKYLFDRFQTTPLSTQSPQKEKREEECQEEKFHEEVKGTSWGENVESLRQEADVLLKMYKSLRSQIHDELSHDEISKENIFSQLQFWESQTTKGNFIGGTKDPTVADFCFFPVLSCLPLVGVWLTKEKSPGLIDYHRQMVRQDFVIASMPIGWGRAQSVKEKL